MSEALLRSSCYVRSFGVLLDPVLLPDAQVVTLARSSLQLVHQLWSLIKRAALWFPLPGWHPGLITVISSTWGCPWRWLRSYNLFRMLCYSQTNGPVMEPPCSSHPAGVALACHSSLSPVQGVGQALHCLGPGSLKDQLTLQATELIYMNLFYFSHPLSCSHLLARAFSMAGAQLCNSIPRGACLFSSV